jgi:hypothetical protein
MNAKDLAEYCASQGIGTIDPETGNIFYSQLPASPDECIAIYDTGGWAKDPELTRADPTFQVIFRAADYDAAQDLIKKFSDLFIPEGIPKKCFNIGTSYIHLVQPMQAAPFGFGLDENGRFKYVWNFTFITH